MRHLRCRCQAGLFETANADLAGVTRQSERDGWVMALVPSADRSDGCLRYHAAREAGRRASSVNMVGTRNKDRNVDELSPPTTASASGRFEAVAGSSPSAVGKSPMMVAKLVIMMGMNRT